LFFLPKPLHGPEKLAEDVVKDFDAQKDGIVRWFSTPPVDIIPPFKAVHSDVYLKYKNSTPEVKDVKVEDVKGKKKAKASPVKAKAVAAAAKSGKGSVKDLVATLTKLADALHGDVAELARVSEV
jgi:hypothetical protein